MAEYVIRAAQPADNEALIALERRSPLIVGETELSFDRAPDFFAASRLQECWRMAVAAAGDRLVGVSASAAYPASLLGRERLLSYTHHMRVDPEYQRHGVGRALGRWLGQSWPPLAIVPERSYAFIDSSNTNSLAFAASGPGPGPWPIDAWMQNLPATEPDAAATAEPLSEADSDEALALLARTHAGLELCPTFSRDWLRARLARSPRYGWAQWRGLRRGGRLVAVAGLLDQGAASATLAHNRRSDETTVGRSLVVLDYGFSDTVAMLALIDALRGEAAARGRHTLAISAPDCSPLFERVMAAASSCLRLKFLAGRLPRTGYAPRGVYLDPIYF
jgi:GNAT superfamily N-acetyltransferase